MKRNNFIASLLAASVLVSMAAGWTGCATEEGSREPNRDRSALMYPGSNEQNVNVWERARRDPDRYDANRGDAERN